MKKTELRKAMNEYQQIAAQIAQLEKQKAAVADRIKAHMDAAGVDEMQVDDATARNGADQRLLDLLYILRRNDQRFLTRVHEFARRIEK